MAVDLGNHPWCNHYLTLQELGTEKSYPLRLVYCHDCQTAQLDYTLAKEVMFGDHTYLSGMTKSLNEHFRKVAVEVDERFFKSVEHKSVVDIGSNDGTQLKHFQALGYDVLGVESSRTTANIAAEHGVPTVNKFFNFSVARGFKRKFHVVNASGVFFHLEELHSVADGIRELLREDGVFVVQFLYMKRIIENVAFDQIYHEHLLYYNLHTIDVLLQRHGLEMFDAYLAPIHGGSIIGFVTHKGKQRPSDRLQTMKQEEIKDRSNEFSTYMAFAEKIKRIKEENLSFLSNAKIKGKTIFGMGAPVKGNTLLNYFGVGTQYIDCLVEINELRRYRYSPGMHIPLVLERELTRQPDIYYVLAWNFKNDILAKHGHLLEKGIEFYFPINPKEC